MSDCFYTIDGQFNDLYNEIDKISQMTFKWPSWLRWLSPFLGHLLAIFYNSLMLTHINETKYRGNSHPWPLLQPASFL